MIQFHKGQTLTADDLNALVREIEEVRRIAESATLRDVHGATFSRDAAGTTLSIPPMPRRLADDDDETIVAASNPRRLFRWSSNKRESTEGAGDVDEPTHDIEVSSGLVVLRPHQLSGAGAGATAISLHPHEVKLDEISASIPKKTFRAEPVLSSCEGIDVIRALTTSTEGADAIAEITAPVSVPVPTYNLQSTGAREVLTSWQSSTATKSTQIKLPAQTSSTEFITSARAILDARVENLSATPNNGTAWTRNVLLDGTKVNLVTAQAPVTLPAQTVDATISVPQYTFGIATVPTGWRLTPNSSENFARDVILRIGVEKFTVPPQWQGVDIIEEPTDATELISLKSATADLKTSLAAPVPDDKASTLLSGRVPDDAEEAPATLHRIPGASFDFTGKELLICLNVAVSGGEPQFFWTEHEIPADGAAAEEFTDDDVPQRATARILGVLEQSGDMIMFGVAAGVAGAFDGMSNWRARVPMAAVWKGEDGAPEIEPLTHGCVEIAPRLRLCIRGGGHVCEGITSAAAPASLSAFPELEAADLAFLESSAS